MRNVIRALCVLGLLLLASLGLMCTPTEQAKSKTVEDAIKSCVQAPTFLVCQEEIIRECRARPCTPAEQTNASADCWTDCFNAFKAGQAGQGGTNG